MRKGLILIIAAASIMLAAISCNKDDMYGNAEQSNITISVNAQMDDLVPDNDTKAFVSPIVRLSWEEGDLLFVYGGNQYLGTLEINLKDNDPRYAYLTGEISAPAAGTTVLTCVYAYGATEAPAVEEGGKIRFSYANQTGATNAIPFVVTGTIPYTAGGSIEDQLVNFSFATSVICVNTTNLDADKAVTRAEISGINTSCVINLSATAAPTVGGADLGFITTTDLTGGNAKLSYYVGIPVSLSTKAASRELTITQSGAMIKKSSFTNASLQQGRSYNVLYSMEDCPYVIINGLKWAKCNVGAETPQDYGYYFFWGGTQGYVRNSDNTKWVDASTGNELNGGFRWEKAPFNDGSDEFNETYFSSVRSTVCPDNFILAKDYDAAYAYLGDNWRMPTPNEFTSMKNATYWAWDNTDKGYYVYEPNPSTDAGKINNNGTGTYDKSNALLFFPAAGYGYKDVLKDADAVSNKGFYWSSSIQYLICYAISFDFTKNNYIQLEGTELCQGHTVRPVSD